MSEEETTSETIFKIEVKVEGEWLPMERFNPTVAPLREKRREELAKTMETYRKPVRLVKIDRTITVLETLDEETKE